MADIPTIVTAALVAYLIVAALSAVLLVAVVADVLVAERRVRVARGANLATHYLRLARSH